MDLREHTAQLSLDSLERNKMRVVPGHVQGDVGCQRLRPTGDRDPIVGAVYKKLGGE